MDERRTDLALEARELSGDTPGVEEETEHCGKAVVTRVRVRTQQGAEKIGKPIGTYITIEQKDLCSKEAQADGSLSQCLAEQISSLLHLKKGDCVLVAGLENRSLTPDSLGPRAAREVLVSRHIFCQLPQALDERVRPVCVLTPGVTGETGLETGEVIRAVVRSVHPACVVVIDALAARSTERILSTVQITDAGVIPGSGVGNHRIGLTQETLGVPVIAIGIPMVVHAATILRDALEKLVGTPLRTDALLRSMECSNLVVTPVMIDEAVQNAAALLAEGVDLALHPQLSREELRLMRI